MTVNDYNRNGIKFNNTKNMNKNRNNKKKYIKIVQKIKNTKINKNSAKNKLNKYFL